MLLTAVGAGERSAVGASALRLRCEVDAVPCSRREYAPGVPWPWPLAPLRACRGGVSNTGECEPSPLPLALADAALAEALADALAVGGVRA